MWAQDWQVWAGPEAVGLGAEKNRRVGSGRDAAGAGRENNTTPLARGGGCGEAGYIMRARSSG